MKKVKNILLVIGAGLFLSSCAATMPAYVTDNGGDKVGRATAKYLFGSIPMNGGDHSIRRACEDGDITKVASVDIKIEGGFFMTKRTTIVMGE